MEVDPQLFVTCRLCLEELGQFQIVPSVQQQIKYCFDIDVELFDGLPQLICTKCKDILTNFHNIKKSVCEKQSKLRENIIKKEINAKCLLPQQDAVSSSQQITETTDTHKVKSQVKRMIVSSESDTSNSVIQSNQKKKIKIKKQKQWNYKGHEMQRFYVCYVCKTKLPNIKLFYKHFSIHYRLRLKYGSIFKNKCRVVLDKVDAKPNLTGVSSTVVLNSNKIIENYSSMYYVRYSKTNDSDSEDSASERIPDLNQESSDSEEKIVGKPNRKKRRILSRSSNETVVIGDNDNKIVSDEEEQEETVTTKESSNEEPQSATGHVTQCINIDDSSDSEPERYRAESNTRTKAPLEASLSDYKIIQNIITACVKSYKKKSEVNEKSDKQLSTLDSQLKHKILSIGRKIINNKQQTAWTGLLRYLEQKNLPIEWVTKTLILGYINQHSNINNIRIMTKLREKEIPEDDQGWKVAPSPITEVPPAVMVPDTSTIKRQEVQNESVSSVQSSALLIKYLNNPPDSKNKLLNANPVANPKKLPKKFAQHSDTKLNKTNTDAVTFQNNVEENDNILMPIITSTKSLAVPNKEQESNKVDGGLLHMPIITHSESLSESNRPTEENNYVTPAPSTTMPAPRIKVKPVSELMSERTLNSLRNEQSLPVSPSNMLSNDNGAAPNVILNQDNIKNVLVQNTNNIGVNNNSWNAQNMPNLYMQLVPLTSIATGSNINTTPAVSTTPKTTFQTKMSKNKNNKEEYVMLNTVELPNTKTKSPFHYLASLLSIYNIVLRDTPETMPREYVCLIKFKVQFTQEPIDEPVLLCLCLLSYDNQFCVTVRDRHQTNINVRTIPPYWQWEILNVFKGDLVAKVLQNARKFSPDTHDVTNKFLCLLNSITKLCQ